MLHTVASTLILAAEDSGGEGIDLLIPETSELIAGVVAFGIIFYFVWKWVLPTLKTTLENRQAAIKSDLEAAEAAKTEAESLRDDYQSQLASARDEANRIVEDSRQAGETVKADIVARAEEEAEVIKARAQDELAAERERANATIPPRGGFPVARRRGEGGRRQPRPGCPGGTGRAVHRRARRSRGLGMDDATHAQTIEGYATALLAVAGAEGDADGVADELYRVAEAFAGSDELRETLSDANVPLDRKLAIVSDLLGSRASNVTVSLVEMLRCHGSDTPNSAR